MNDIFTKDPDAILDYSIDWSRYLATGVTISTSSWTVPSGIIDLSDSNTTTTTTVVLSGGTADTDYSLTNHVVLSDGNEDDRSITIAVREL